MSEPSSSDSILHAWYEEEDGSVIGYMCRTAYEYELGQAVDGNKIFPSIKSLKEHVKCAESCGIVEVKVFFNALISPGTDNERS